MNLQKKLILSFFIFIFIFSFITVPVYSQESSFIATEDINKLKKNIESWTEEIENILKKVNSEDVTREELIELNIQMEKLKLKISSALKELQYNYPEKFGNLNLDSLDASTTNIKIQSSKQVLKDLSKVERYRKVEKVYNKYNVNNIEDDCKKLEKAFKEIIEQEDVLNDYNTELERINQEILIVQDIGEKKAMLERYNFLKTENDKYIEKYSVLKYKYTLKITSQNCNSVEIFYYNYQSLKKSAENNLKKLNPLLENSKVIADYNYKKYNNLKKNLQTEINKRINKNDSSQLKESINNLKKYNDKAEEYIGEINFFLSESKKSNKKKKEEINKKYNNIRIDYITLNEKMKNVDAGNLDAQIAQLKLSYDAFNKIDVDSQNFTSSYNIFNSQLDDFKNKYDLLNYNFSKFVTQEKEIEVYTAYSTVYSLYNEYKERYKIIEDLKINSESLPDSDLILLKLNDEIVQKYQNLENAKKQFENEKKITNYNLFNDKINELNSRISDTQLSIVTLINIKSDNQYADRLEKIKELSSQLLKIKLLEEEMKSYLFYSSIYETYKNEYNNFSLKINELTEKITVLNYPFDVNYTTIKNNMNLKIRSINNSIVNSLKTKTLYMLSDDFEFVISAEYSDTNLSMCYNHFKENTGYNENQICDVKLFYLKDSFISNYEKALKYYNVAKELNQNKLNTFFNTYDKRNSYTTNFNDITGISIAENNIYDYLVSFALENEFLTYYLELLE